MKTNIIGSQNLIEVSLKKNIKKVVLISTDKAVSPINLYGSTKLTAEKLFISANIFKGAKKSNFSVVRYGNVMGSRGSVIPIFLKQKKDKFFTVTNKDMTRFNISLDYAVKFVSKCIFSMRGGEIFVPKLPSYRILDLAKAIDSSKKIKIIGIRTGEKIHEELVSSNEFQITVQKKDSFTIYPLRNNQKDNRRPYSYNSFNNPNYLNISQIKKLISTNIKDFDSI